MAAEELKKVSFLQKSFRKYFCYRKALEGLVFPEELYKVSGHKGALKCLLVPEMFRKVSCFQKSIIRVLYPLKTCFLVP